MKKTNNNAAIFVLRPQDGFTEELIKMYHAMMDLTEAPLLKDEKLEIHFVIDLLKVDGVTTAFLGTVASAIGLEHVRLVALCEMDETLTDWSTRVGMIPSPETGEYSGKAASSISENRHKIKAFSSVADAIGSIFAGVSA
jgi:hypothetical protein